MYSLSRVQVSLAVRFAVTEMVAASAAPRAGAARAAYRTAARTACGHRIILICSLEEVTVGVRLRFSSRGRYRRRVTIAYRRGDSLGAGGVTNPARRAHGIATRRGQRSVQLPGATRPTPPAPPAATRAPPSPPTHT